MVKSWEKAELRRRFPVSPKAPEGPLCKGCCFKRIVPGAGDYCESCAATIAERQAARERLSGALVGKAEPNARARIAYLEMLLACKNEALGVFADPKMWQETFHETIYCTTRRGYEWNGADAYKNPMAFAKREMERQEPSDSIGSVTHTE